MQTIEEILGEFKARCDAGDVKRARRYYTANPGNGMDDCARWLESLCPTCAEMATSPALGKELDTFCEHALTDVPRLIAAVEFLRKRGVQFKEDSVWLKNFNEELACILRGEGD